MVISDFINRKKCLYVVQCIHFGKTFLSLFANDFNEFYFLT